MNTDIFKAYDVRGKVGSELNDEVCDLIGRSFAEFLPQNGVVVVGRDMRPDSEALSRAIITGLNAQGRDVWDIGEVTTDMIYFAVGKFSLAGGVMVTASHNPGEYNGIKFCREEARAIGIESGLDKIRDRAVENNFTSAAKLGQIEQKDIRKDWIEHVLSFVDTSKWEAYRVAVDAGNGMVGAIMPVLQPEVPLKVEPMYFELDGTFPNHIANPLDESTLKDIQAKITGEKLDFGMAFDGDGDRAVLIDENGQTISGTVMTAILAKYFLAKKPGSTILCNAICGRAAKESVEENGGRFIRTKVGHSYIKGDMRLYNAVFAGEHSGHFYFRDNWSADSGLLAVVIAIQVFAESGKAKMSELAAEYRNKYLSILETNFEVADKERVIDKVREAFADGEQDDLDGLTINYPDGWLNVRASNTEPLLRLNAESKTKENLDKIVAKVTGIITKG